MRKIWTILAVFAIGNLLAMIGGVGWLGASGRLSVERMRVVREMFSETVAVQMAREKVEEDEAAAAAELADASEQRFVAMSSAEVMQYRLDSIEADRERRRRHLQEFRDLDDALARRETTLALDRSAFETERKAHEEYLADIAQTDGDVQFRKAIKVLDGLTAQDAAGIITALIGTGRDGVLDDADDAENADDAPGLRLAGVDRAVSYLNGMQDRSRLKLMAVLSASQPGLAAELLERLRTRGLPAATAQAP